MKSILLFAFLISVVTAGLAQQNASCPPASVEYKNQAVDVSKVKVGSHPKAALTVADDQRTDVSTGNSVASAVNCGNCSVTIGDSLRTLVRVTLPNDGGNGITARWINEKLVFLEYFPGSSVAIDLILEVDSGKFIDSEAAHPAVQQFCRQP